ncbi:CPBP family intramembrane glutamic endopeptidase [Aquirufa antheringensis]|uniref:CPBP family intramembrane glutamic endopeptidase n=1 Tax=Aquirufa antheringensis TaxID=2516559 RepID=UPI001032D0DE|nr:CPBP family intramembrane glutamic endopeptidase [Aquirufa antheringensis]MCZ2477263.1 CPBP family intramembrane metalloprotease [Aquirufa antheringensis]TBH70384.1 CPBP family intramembrane metalloprotease [Aquirufa antheringensis]
MVDNNFQGPERYIGLLSKILILFGFFLLGGFIGQFIGLFSVVIITGMPINNELVLQKSVIDFLVHPQNYENGLRALMSFQWFSALFTFVASSWAYLRWSEKRDLNSLSLGPTPDYRLFLWTIITLLVGMPVMEFLIKWNESIVFPAGFEETEKWMRASETQMAELTKFLLDFRSPTDFAMGLAVIAGLAALGEELFFRGVLQSLFERYTGNHHVAIWVSAGIFSFIHFQFFGFFPRLFLGAFFGYLYVWNRNIWIPIVAHLFNNGWTLTMQYMYQQKQIAVDPEKLGELTPWWSVVISFGLVVFYIRRLHSMRLEK